jgi:predicted nucleotidyltransferase component of viral defense system
MINRAEIEAIANQFGAPDAQITRDHLISHVLAAIGDWPDSGRITFFGGTALCRTWLPDLRLSEDIDLLIDSPIHTEALRTQITRGLRREYPGLTWNPLGAQHQVETWNLVVDDLDVRVQLAQWRQGWQAIPIVSQAVRLRYSDLPESAQLRVPTPSGFATMKLMAWFDRRTPRDLYDLAALADAGHIDQAAVARVRAIAGFTPDTTTLERTVPRSVVASWPIELGHQVSDLASPEDCFAKVRAALTQIAE